MMRQKEWKKLLFLDLSFWSRRWEIHTAFYILIGCEVEVKCFFLLKTVIQRQGVIWANADKMTMLLWGIIFILQYNYTGPPTLIPAFSISDFFQPYHGNEISATFSSWKLCIIHLVDLTYSGTLLDEYTFLSLGYKRGKEISIYNSENCRSELNMMPMYLYSFGREKFYFATSCFPCILGLY